MLADFPLMLASIIACVLKLLYSHFLCSCSALSSYHLYCLQAARTYLERKFEEFESCSLDQLIRHSLQVWLLAFEMLDKIGRPVHAFAVVHATPVTSPVKSRCMGHMRQMYCVVICRRFLPACQRVT